MQASIYIETHDIATLMKHAVPLMKLHTSSLSIEGMDNVNLFIDGVKRKQKAALELIAVGATIYGEWL